MEHSKHPGSDHHFGNSDCKPCTLYNMHRELEAASIEIGATYLLSLGGTVNPGADAELLV